MASEGDVKRARRCELQVGSEVKVTDSGPDSCYASTSHERQDPQPQHLVPGLVGLPREILIQILRLYYTLCDKERETQTNTLPGNYLHPLRLVSRAFREVVDQEIWFLACQVTSHGRRNPLLLSRLGHSLQHVVLRWPRLTNLNLGFDHWKPDHLLFALGSIAASCRQLGHLYLHSSCQHGLHAGLEEEDEGDDPPWAAVFGSFTSLASLVLRNMAGYPSCIHGLSGLADRLALLSLFNCGGGVLPALPALTKIDFEDDSEDRPSWFMPHLHQSTGLTSLTLKGVFMMDLPLPTSLTELNLCSVTVVAQIDRDLRLPHLRSLTLRAVPFTCLPPLSASTGLRKLDLHYVVGMPSLPKLSHMSKLSRLRLCALSIARVPPLEFRNLRSFTLASCSSVRFLTLHGSCSQLRTIKLESLEQFQFVAALRVATNLTSLSIKACPQYELPPLPQSLSNLQSLTLREIQPSGTSLNLQRLVRLKELSLTDLPSLKSLGKLEDLPRLRSLVLRNLLDLKLGAKLASLTALERLSISGCPRVKALSLASSAARSSIRIEGVRLSFGEAEKE